MGIFDWFKRKDKRANHTFNDGDREVSVEIRQKKKELELLKLERENELSKLKMFKAKLELENEIEELQEAMADNTDDMQPETDGTTELIKLFAPLLLKNINPSASVLDVPIQSFSPLQEQKLSLSDEQLKEIWNRTPEMAKNYAKKAPDDTISKLILSQMPNIDADTLARALKLIKTA